MRYTWLVFSMSSADFLRVVARIAAGTNPGIYASFRSSRYDAAAGEKIVLAALARVHIQWGHTRPELSTFTAQSEVPVDLHIESQTSLQYTRGVSRRVRVSARTSTEIAESTTKTDPRRDCLLRKKVQAGRGNDKV